MAPVHVTEIEWDAERCIAVPAVRLGAAEAGLR